MPNPNAWWQIDTSLLDLSKRTDEADAWAKEQRAKVADLWAQTQRQAVHTMATTYQQGLDSLDHFSGGFQSAPDSGTGPTAPSGYNDMAGARSGPVDQGLSSTQGKLGAFNKVVPSTDPYASIAKTVPQAAEPNAGDNLIASMREGASRSGIYQPPPPGTPSNPLEEIGKMIQAEANRTRPTPGPGGLGLFNPNQVPGAANPSEEATALAGDVMGKIPGIGGVAKFAVGGGTGSGLNPQTQKLVSMYTDEVPKVSTPLATQVRTLSDAFVRAWTDRGQPLADFQKMVRGVAGRNLNVNEMAAELSRLNPDKAAEVAIQKGLQPAIQSVPEADLPVLSSYLTAMHNVDVAKAIGQKIEHAVLIKPLKATIGEQRVATIKKQIAAYQRLRETGVVAGDGTMVTRYDQMIDEATTKLASATKLALKQVTRSDAVRQVRAGAAGQLAEDSRHFSGGLNAAQSAEVIRSLPGDIGAGRFQVIQDAAKKVWAFSDTMRDKAVKSGLWTQELADQLRQDYEHYVPTKILDYMDDPARIASGTSLSVRDQGLKRLTVEGTERSREDPLASMVRSAYQMEALTKRNDAFNAFVNLNNLLPEGQRIIRKVADDFTATNAQVKVSGFIQGKRTTFVMPKEFETVVKQEANAPIKGLAPAMALYRSLITSLNPAFVAGQIPLDAMSYVIRESTRGGGPQALPQVLTELFKAYGDAMKGVASRTYGGEGTQRFLSGGGGMGGYFQGRPGDAAKTVGALARTSAIQVNSAADIGRIVKDILTLKPVLAVGERTELAPRVASMRLAEKRGLDAVTGIINGRTVTMDFQQGGTVAKFINQFIPFFNVGMQGLATPARVIRDNPKAALATFVSYLAAPTVASEVWNNADPQRAKDYADIPQYIKDRSVVIMLPMPASVDVGGERHPQYIEIRSREFSPFVDLTRATMRTVLGTETRSWQDMLGGAINASSPIQTDSALGMFGSLVPPGISTGYDLSQNRNSYTGSTIATAGADERASALSKAGAEGIYQATGVNARPSQVEFASRDLTGGAGQIVRDVSNLVAGQPGQGTPQDTPLLGQVTRRFVGGSIGQRLQSAQDQRITGETEKVLRDAGIYDISPVASSIKGLPLSRDEQAIYQNASNRAINSIVAKAGKSAAFQKLSQSEKADILHAMMDDMRQTAAEFTLGQIDPAGLKDRIRRQFDAEMKAAS